MIYFTMETEFVTWLVHELNEKGWNNSELARRAGIVPSTVSMILSQQKKPGPSFCTGIAHALSVPPERVFRKAGLLPPTIIGDDVEQEKQGLLDHFQYLNQEDRRVISLMAQTLYEKRAEYKVTKKK